MLNAEKKSLWLFFDLLFIAGNNFIVIFYFNVLKYKMKKFLKTLLVIFAVIPVVVLTACGSGGSGDKKSGDGNNDDGNGGIQQPSVPQKLPVSDFFNGICFTYTDDSEEPDEGEDYPKVTIPNADIEESNDIARIYNEIILKPKAGTPISKLELQGSGNGGGYFSYTIWVSINYNGTSTNSTSIGNFSHTSNASTREINFETLFPELKDKTFEEYTTSSNFITLKFISTAPGIGDPFRANFTGYWGIPV